MFLCTAFPPYCIFHLPVLYPYAFCMDASILLHKNLSLETLIITMVTVFLFHLKVAAAILKWSSLLPGSRQCRKWGEADLELGHHEWVTCSDSSNSGLIFTGNLLTVQAQKNGSEHWFLGVGYVSRFEISSFVAVSLKTDMGWACGSTWVATLEG